MRRFNPVLCAMAGVSVLAISACNKPPADAPKVDAAAPAAPAGGMILKVDATDADKIASAMEAAPKAIAMDATILDMGADGKMKELRKGTNNFSCMADNPATPGPDPTCGDSNAMEFMMAMMTGKAPPKKVGFVYMLQGGVDASNTDPKATAPAAGEDWVRTGPHVMIVGSTEATAGYPKDAKPDTTKAYVMFPGTPYEHLMVPTAG